MNKFYASIGAAFRYRDVISIKIVEKKKHYYASWWQAMFGHKAIEEITGYEIYVKFHGGHNMNIQCPSKEDAEKHFHLLLKELEEDAKNDSPGTETGPVGVKG